MAAGQSFDVAMIFPALHEPVTENHNVGHTYPSSELKNLLAEGPESTRNRLGELFDRAAGDAKDRIVLCGAGPLGRRTLRGLRKIGIEPLGFLDNNAKIWHNEVDGLRVFPPQEIVAAYRDSAVFVVTIFNNLAVRRQLAEMRCQHIVAFHHLYWKFAEAFLPYCSLGDIEPIFAEQAAITEADGLWADELSRDYYSSQLVWRLTLNSAILPEPCPAKDTYFPDDVLCPLKDEVFVDCGAFDGDSVRAFIERRGGEFKTIVPLEPDPQNFAALSHYVDGLDPAVRSRFVPTPMAAGSFNGVISFDSQGDMSSTVTASGTLSLKCARLDDILADFPPTYVKMDIEGAELDALEGAAWRDCRAPPRPGNLRVSQAKRSLADPAEDQIALPRLSIISPALCRRLLGAGLLRGPGKSARQAAQRKRVRL